jgi:hypothetical protein
MITSGAASRIPASIAVAQQRQIRRSGEPLEGGFRRSPKARDTDKVLGAAAMALFLAATGDQRRRHQDFAGTLSAPIPFGPPILWPDRIRKSAPSSRATAAYARRPAPHRPPSARDAP